MDIYERLTKDHNTHREMATRLAETTGDSEDRRKLWEEFKPEAEAHANAEEQTFYATLIETPEAQEKARHSISEHKEAADLMEKLSAEDMSSPGWLQNFKKLKEELEHHMDEEENEVFMKARTVISDETATKLVSDFEERKAAEL
ncbi:MAG: hemerythrin domain-containing protein [Acidimicrobiales bacterium]|nr:hemerythrin domain-containing protein [Acidimicrobiales bacterium]